MLNSCEHEAHEHIERPLRILFNVEAGAMVSSAKNTNIFPQHTLHQNIKILGIFQKLHQLKTHLTFFKFSRLSRRKIGTKMEIFRKICTMRDLFSLSNFSCKIQGLFLKYYFFASFCRFFPGIYLDFFLIRLADEQRRNVNIHVFAVVLFDFIVLCRMNKWLWRAKWRVQWVWVELIQI